MQNQIKSAAKNPLLGEMLKRRFKQVKQTLPSIAEDQPRQTSRYRQPVETSRLRSLFPKYPKNTL